MQELIEILRTEQLSLVVKSTDGEIFRFTGRGVKDLYDLLTREPDVLQGSEVADKVVGKGAAALMIEGGVKSLNALIISQAAKDLLDSYNVYYKYEKSVPVIINRNGDDICPVEKLTADAGTAAECVERITEFLQKRN